MAGPLRAGMIEVDYRVRETVRRAEKEAIGRLAGHSSGRGTPSSSMRDTTTAYLALAMDDTKRITVVTSSTMVLQALETGRTSRRSCWAKVHALSHPWWDPSRWTPFGSSDSQKPSWR